MLLKPLCASDLGLVCLDEGVGSEKARREGPVRVQVSEEGGKAGVTERCCRYGTVSGSIEQRGEERKGAKGQPPDCECKFQAGHAQQVV